LPFHALNRAVGRRTIFESAADYAEFIDVVAEALRTRLLDCPDLVAGTVFPRRGVGPLLLDARP